MVDNQGITSQAEDMHPVLEKRNFTIANGENWDSDVYTIDGWNKICVVVVADKNLKVRSYQGPDDADDEASMKEYYEIDYTANSRTDNTIIDEVVLDKGMVRLINNSGAEATVDFLSIRLKRV